MAKYVKIASLLFDQEHLRAHKDARERVLAETKKNLDALKGLDLDLVVTSEGIESLAQTVGDAENLAKPGPLLEMYMEFAVSEKCHVAGSVKIEDGGKIFNSLAFVSPSGRVLGVYHKTNLTIGEIEEGLSPGTVALCVNTEIGRLGCAICFDLNFEKLRKQYVKMKPDIMIFPSMFHGGLMQQVWAYECRAFFVSAIPFHGGGILDPFGHPVALTDCYNTVAMAKINLDRAMLHLDYNRDKFTGILKKYKDEVRIDIPANIGSALIYSESKKRTAADIVKEYGLELIDDYFKRALDRNKKAGRESEDI